MITLLSFSFVACGSDDEDPADTTNPTMNITNPIDNDTIFIDVNSIIVEGTLNDNVELASCNISLAYTGTDASAFIEDDNSLKSTSTEGDSHDPVTGIDDEPWAPDAVDISLSGSSYTFEDNYQPFGSVPGNIKTGEYTLTISVEDAAGNLTSEDILLNFTE